VLDLALLNEVLHRSCDVFDRNLWVHTVLVYRSMASTLSR
jgi:hypothetical protein